jgi:hypothetical protein
MKRGGGRSLRVNQTKSELIKNIYTSDGDNEKNKQSLFLFL